MINGLRGASSDIDVVHPLESSETKVRMDIARLFIDLYKNYFSILTFSVVVTQVSVFIKYHK